MTLLPPKAAAAGALAVAVAGFSMIWAQVPTDGTDFHAPAAQCIPVALLSGAIFLAASEALPLALSLTAVAMSQLPLFIASSHVASDTSELDYDLWAAWPLDNNLKWAAAGYGLCAAALCVAALAFLEMPSLLALATTSVPKQMMGGSLLVALALLIAGAVELTRKPDGVDATATGDDVSNIVDSVLLVLLFALAMLKGGVWTSVAVLAGASQAAGMAAYAAAMQGGRDVVCDISFFEADCDDYGNQLHGAGVLAALGAFVVVIAATPLLTRPGSDGDSWQQAALWRGAPVLVIVVLGYMGSVDTGDDEYVVNDVENIMTTFTMYAGLVLVYGRVKGGEYEWVNQVQALGIALVVGLTAPSLMVQPASYGGGNNDCFVDKSCSLPYGPTALWTGAMVVAALSIARKALKPAKAPAVILAACLYLLAFVLAIPQVKSAFSDGDDALIYAAAEQPFQLMFLSVVLALLFACSQNTLAPRAFRGIVLFLVVANAVGTLAMLDEACNGARGGSLIGSQKAFLAATLISTLASGVAMRTLLADKDAWGAADWATDARESLIGAPRV